MTQQLEALEHETKLAGAQAGARVALVGRTADELERVARAIRDAGGEARVVVADVADYNRFLMQILLGHPSVAGAASHFALAMTKYTTVIPV